MKYKKGDVLVKGKYKIKVLACIDDLIFHTCSDEDDSIAWPSTHKNLEEHGWTLETQGALCTKENGKDVCPCEMGFKHVGKEEQPWDPQRGDEFYMIGSDGMASRYPWTNSVYERALRDFLGVFPTESAAKKRIEEVREWLKGKNSQPLGS